MRVSDEIFCNYYKSPIGLLEINGNDLGISSVMFVEEQSVQLDSEHPLLEKCVKQLDEYFKGTRKTFDLLLNFAGTEFQNKVWNCILKIPYGKTATYLDIARELDDENATRAVGAANGKNRIMIIVPCHRIIGSNGQLTGYAAGTWRKKFLLKHEVNYTYGKQTELFESFISTDF